MTRKALWLLPASLAVVVASQWRDIARYLKIQQMSRGAPPAPPPAEDGHGTPERLLPAALTPGCAYSRLRLLPAALTPGCA